MRDRPAVFLKRTLLACWATWLTVVFATNLMDLGKALGLVPEGFAFASGNYRFLVETTARYGPPAWLSGLLFLGVVCWEGLAALLFWLAWRRFQGRGEAGRRTLHAAFLAGLTLWAAFMIADELFIAYAVEAVHVRLLTAQLATLLAIELLPEETPPAA
jgi:hypothetical protein